MRWMLICLCLMVLIVSCGDKKGAAKSGIINTEKMGAVMWDMFQADAFTERYLKIDSTKNAAVQNAALQQKIFELHKISKDEFYKSYNYYSNHPDLMRTMLDSITARADRDRNKLMMEKYSGNRHPPVN